MHRQSDKWPAPPQLKPERRMMPRKAAAYLRVSSQQQAASDRWGLARQQQDVARYAGASDLQISETFRDSITGSSTTRKGLSDLKKFCADRSVEAVVISSIDRLARDVSASYKLLAELIDLGVEVHSADHGPIDLSIEESTINFSLRTLFSHLERNKIVARTKAARMAMAENDKLPTGIRAYGYRNAGGDAIIYPTEAATVRYIFEAAAARVTHMAIAAELNRRGTPTYSKVQDPKKQSLWTKQTVGGMIRNETYKGVYRWSRFVIKVPPIVSPELWQQAQPPRRGPRPRYGFPLLGHIRCGVCGRRMSGRVRKHRKVNTEYYRCNGHGLVNGCTTPDVRRDFIEPLTETMVRETVTNPEMLASLMGTVRQENPKLDEQLAEIAAEDERWLEAFRLGAITPAELSEYRNQLASRRRALEAPQPALAPALPDFTDILASEPLSEVMEASGLVVIATNATARLVFEP